MKKTLKITLIIAGTLAFTALICYLVYFSGMSGRPVPGLVSGSLSSSTPSESAGYAHVRESAVAGQFYEAGSDRLRADVAGFIRDAKPAAGGQPAIIIVPHAGHAYSGPVAAYAFKEIIGSGYSRAVIIGRSHRGWFSGVAADGHDAWSTPVGEVAVDRDFIASLEAVDGSPVKTDSSAHEQEHSIEVQVPFIIETLGPEVKIVPLLFGSEDSGTAAKLADALSKIMDDLTVVIVSTDLSHYPKTEDAAKVDAETIGAILAGDPAGFAAKIKEIESGDTPQLDTAACAAVAVESGLGLAAKLNIKPRLLKYANSGQVVKETADRSVGYAAISFDLPAGAAPSELNEAEKEEAVQIVWDTLRASFKKEKFQPKPSADIFTGHRGVFVTLKKSGQLRGCVGVFAPDQPLSDSIRDMALAAAFEDGRFEPLEEDELADIEPEISVLSPMARIYEPLLVEPGVHGVVVSNGRSRGVFLPQVATEQGWGREKFLSELCSQKAGLDSDCWKDSATEMEIFTAQVFD
jgi:hypothetical protein